MGILLTDGSRATIFAALTAKFDARGALWDVIAPKGEGVSFNDGTKVAVRHSLDGARYVLFDAVAVFGSEAGAALLATNAVAKGFVSDAFVHCKFIGHSKAALLLFARGVPHPNSTTDSLH